MQASDGCTFWPDGAWHHCCVAHDIAYGAGRDRIAADLDLVSCVAATGHPVMALVMGVGVLAFGWWWWRRG